MKTILLLDCDDNSRRVLKHQLSQMGCAVDFTADQGTAVHLCENKDYDLLCVRANGPLATIGSFFRQIRQVDPALPIIVLSTFSSVENIVLARRYGVKDCVERPCDCITLRRSVERLLA